MGSKGERVGERGHSPESRLRAAGGRGDLPKLWKKP